MIKTIAAYYPRYCNPIHEVKNWCYVRSIIRAARRGVAIPAIVMDGESLLTGTHRSAANDLMQMLEDARDTSPKRCLIDTAQFDDLELEEETREAIIEALEYNEYDTVDALLGDRTGGHGF